MNKVLNGIVNNPMGWISNRVATLSETTEGVKNTLSTLTSGLLVVKNTPVELIKLVERCEAVILLKDFSVYLKQVVDRINPVMLNAMPSVNGVLSSLESAKDCLTFLEFFSYVRDSGAKDLKDKTFAKQANLACKLGFSSLETFLLIPNKFKWIDLGKLCESVGIYSPLANLTITNFFKLTSSTFIVASSVFGIWSANQDINKANEALGKNLDRKIYLKKLEGPNTSEILREHFKIQTEEEDTVKKEKSSKLVKAYKDILRLSGEVKSLNNQMNDLKAGSKNNDGKVTKLNNELEDPIKGKKVTLKAAQEKACRIVALYSAANGTNLSEDALRVVKNEFIYTSIKDNLHKIQSQQKRTILEQLLAKDSPPDFSAVLKAAKNSESQSEDDQFLKNLTEKTSSYHSLLVEATKVRRNDAIKHTVDYKNYKVSQNNVGNESIITKSQWTRMYEISKIAIVVFVTLSTILIPASLAPALVISYAASVATATWGSGLAICLLGGIRTVHTIFFWTDPKKLPRPTTDLTHLAV
jgi:hypothetical protein